VRTVRAECLDWLLIVGRGHLEQVLRTYVEHYNQHRPHRALGLESRERIPTRGADLVRGVRRRFSAESDWTGASPASVAVRQCRKVGELG
jgi:hypothetical protein